MATATDRGWGNPPAPRTVKVPCAGIQLNIRPEVAPLFAELIRQVELIRGAGWMVSSGGYNPRPVRGYEAQYAATKNVKYLSNHAWGLAADFRAGTNPMQNTLKTDMPANIKAIADSLGMQWGGSYTGRKDPMHFEVVVTPAEAAQIVARLNTNPAQEDDMTPDQEARQIRIESMLAEVLTQMYGPRDSTGIIKGWPQLNNMTTVDAIAATLHAVTDKFESGVPGSTTKMTPRDAWRNADAYGYTTNGRQGEVVSVVQALAQTVANESGVDKREVEAIVKAALADSIVKVDVSVNNGTGA